jgi:CRP/FNR family transcriptional regulator, cyclic AMP receptor protein
VDVRAREMSEVCRVLDQDPGLAEAIPLEHREQAARECIAKTLAVPAGRWRPPRSAPSGEGIGLLVLRGLLIRRVGVDGRFGAELLGGGDLLRPWEAEDETQTLPVTTGWRIVEPARMAVLDERFAQRIGRHPRAIGCLTGRALARSRKFAVNMAIVHQARVDVRLHMLFWHLASRWGRVRTDGVSLPLRLTHSVLADLAAARRPTITSALSELSRRGLVRALDDGWLLAGRPPGDLLELAPGPTGLTDARASRRRPAYRRAREPLAP